MSSTRSRFYFTMIFGEMLSEFPFWTFFFLDRNAKLQGTSACVPRGFQGLALSAIVTVITRSTYCTLPFLLNPTSPDDLQAPCYRGRAVQWLKRHDQSRDQF